MIRRTLDPAPFIEVSLHPEVRPWLGGVGDDRALVERITALVSNPANICLLNEGGGFILETGPGASFEVHSQFTPEGRKSSLDAMRAGMDYMFTRTPCLQITTFLPDNNPAAQGLARKGGFQPWFRRNHPTMGEGEMARIDIDQWIAGTPDLEADGGMFHDVLEAAKKETGSELPVHDHDPIHERYVGAALRMFARGQTRKAEVLYNRWASNAGYVQIKVISDNPPVVDVGDGIATIKDGLTEMLLTRKFS